MANLKYLIFCSLSLYYWVSSSWKRGWYLHTTLVSTHRRWQAVDGFMKCFFQSFWNILITSIKQRLGILEKLQVFMLHSLYMQEFLFLIWILSLFWSKKNSSGLWRVSLKIANENKSVGTYKRCEHMEALRKGRGRRSINSVCTTLPKWESSVGKQFISYESSVLRM